MATIKFKSSSPYKQKKLQPPPEDYLYAKYLKDISLQSSDVDEKVLNVALFGIGRAGTIHLTTLARSIRVNLLYIVDDDESKWAPIKRYWKLDGTSFLSSKDAEKVYKDAKIDAVIVASPTFTHEDIVTKALAAKKDVFCEKPIAEDRTNSAKCYDAAKRAGKTLFCAFNRRFDPSYNAVRNRVRQGEVGHVQIIKVTSRDSPLPTIEYLKFSGAIFHDCMVHDIDMITWVVGEYPIKVGVQAHAHVPEIKEVNDFDTVVATLYFPSGTLGMIDLSRNSTYGYDQRLEVFGAKGMVHANNEQPMHGVTTQYDLQGPKTPPIWYSFPSRYKTAYENELNHFLDVILDKTKSLVDPKETLAVSKIASACEESARTGKMVEISWAPGELPAYDC